VSGRQPLPDLALELWRFTAPEPLTVQVAPDGCRDLIVIVPKRGAPTCHVSALSDSLETYAFRPGDRALGVRMRPGAQFDEQALPALLRGGERQDDGDLLAALSVATRLDARVDEALTCLAEAPSLALALALAQARLGVSARSLERLLATHTRRGPLWWRSLARVRRCARALAGDAPLAALAADHGYADQPHMTRDLRRWFGMTPTRLRTVPALLATLDAPAYA